MAAKSLTLTNVVLAIEAIKKASVHPLFNVSFMPDQSKLFTNGGRTPGVGAPLMLKAARIAASQKPDTPGQIKALSNVHDSHENLQGRQPCL